MSFQDAAFKPRVEFHQNPVETIPKSSLHKLKHSQRSIEDKNVSNGLLDKFYDSKYSVIGKVLWLTILIVCLALTVMQISNRICHYLSQPVTAIVEIERTHAIDFPHITLCNREPFLRSAIMKLRQEVGYRRGKSSDSITMNDLMEEYGIDFLWENASYNVPDMLLECFYSRKTCNTYGDWVPIKTVLGVCHTYQLGRPNRITGPYTGLYIDIKEDSKQTNDTSRGWKLIVHHSKEYPGVMVKTKGATFYPDSRADMVLILREFHKVSTRAKPCLDDPDYQLTECFARCLYQAIAENVSCQLPYMNLANVPRCNTSATYNAAVRLQDLSLLSGDTWAERKCHCPRPCREYIYGTRTDLRWWPNDVRTVIRVYYEHLMYESVQEQLTYGLVPLLCDIGGTLGLFLGVCVLTLFDTLESAIGSLIRNRIRSNAVVKQCF